MADDYQEQDTTMLLFPDLNEADHMKGDVWDIEQDEGQSPAEALLEALLGWKYAEASEEKQLSAIKKWLNYESANAAPAEVWTDLKKRRLIPADYERGTALKRL